NRAVLEAPATELLEHRARLLVREDPVDDPAQARGATEVIVVRAEHDLLASIPALEPEWPRAHRRRPEGVTLLGHEIAGDDLGMSDGEHGHERHLSLVEHD